MVGEFGTIERMHGGHPPGARGALHGVPEDTYVYDAWFDAEGKTGIAVGLAGTILRSTDSRRELGAGEDRASREDLFGVGGAGTRVVVVGEGGLVALSTDGGLTFAKAESPPLPVALTDVDFADADHAFAVGPRGLVLRSTDGGAHWSTRAPGSGEMSAAERFSRFSRGGRTGSRWRSRVVTGFFAWQMRHLEIYTQFLDLLPRNHPFIRTYEGYREVYGNANTVVAAVVAKDGDIYQPEVLRAIQSSPRSSTRPSSPPR